MTPKDSVEKKVEDKSPDYGASIFSDTNATLGEFEKRILERVRNEREQFVKERIDPILSPMEDSMKATQVAKDNKLFQQIIESPALRDEIDALRNDPASNEVYGDPKLNFIKAIALDAYNKGREKKMVGKKKGGGVKKAGAASPRKAPTTPQSPIESDEKMAKMSDAEFGKMIQKLQYEAE